MRSATRFAARAHFAANSSKNTVYCRLKAVLTFYFHIGFPTSRHELCNSKCPMHAKHRRQLRAERHYVELDCGSCQLETFSWSDIFSAPSAASTAQILRQKLAQQQQNAEISKLLRGSNGQYSGKMIPSVRVESRHLLSDLRCSVHRPPPPSEISTISYSTIFGNLEHLPYSITSQCVGYSWTRFKTGHRHTA